MGPTNNHERAIARIVDDLDTEGRLSPTSIEDVIAHLSFAMTKADSVFLVRYIRWRMDHPIAQEGPGVSDVEEDSK
jgi:hypothetical protein